MDAPELKDGSGADASGHLGSDGGIRATTAGEGLPPGTPHRPARPVSARVISSNRLRLNHAIVAPTTANVLTASVSKDSFRGALDLGFRPSTAQSFHIPSPISVSVVHQAIPFNDTPRSLRAVDNAGRALRDRDVPPDGRVSTAPVAATALVSGVSTPAAAREDDSLVQGLSVSESAIDAADAEIDVVLRATAKIKRLDGRRVSLVGPPRSTVEEAWFIDEDDDFDKYGKSTDPGVTELFVDLSTEAGRTSCDDGRPSTAAGTRPSKRMTRAVRSATGRRLRFDKLEFARAAVTFADNAAPAAARLLVPFGSSNAVAVRASGILADIHASPPLAEPGAPIAAEAPRRVSQASEAPPVSSPADATFFMTEPPPPVASTPVSAASRSTTSLPQIHLQPDAVETIDVRALAAFAAIHKQLGPPKHLLTRQTERHQASASAWAATPSRDEDARCAIRSTTGPDVGPGTYKVPAGTQVVRPKSAKFSTLDRFGPNSSAERARQLVTDEMHRMAREQYERAAQRRHLSNNDVPSSGDEETPVAAAQTSRDPKALREERALAASRRREALTAAKLQQSLQQWNAVANVVENKRIKMWLTATRVLTFFYRIHMAVRRHRMQKTNDAIFQSWMPIKRKVFDGWREYCRMRKLLWASATLRKHLSPVVRLRVLKKRQAMAGIVLHFLREVDSMQKFARNVRQFVGRVRKVQRWVKSMYRVLLAQRALVMLQWDIVEVQIRVAALKHKLLQGHRRSSITKAIERMGARLERRISQMHEAMHSGGAPVTDATKLDDLRRGSVGQAVLAWPEIRSTADREDLNAEFAVGIGILRPKTEETAVRPPSGSVARRNSLRPETAGRRNSIQRRGSTTAAVTVLEGEEMRWNNILSEALRQAAIQRETETEPGTHHVEPHKHDSTPTHKHSHDSLDEVNFHHHHHASSRRRTSIDARAAAPDAKRRPPVQPHRRASISMTLSIGTDAAVDVSRLVMPTTEVTHGAVEIRSSLPHLLGPAAPTAPLSNTGAAPQGLPPRPVPPPEAPAPSDGPVITIEQELVALQRAVLEEYPPISLSVKRAKVAEILRSTRQLHLRAIRTYRARIAMWDSTFEAQVSRAEDRVRAIRGYISPNEAAAVRQAVANHRPKPPTYIALQRYQDLEGTIRQIYADMERRRSEARLDRERKASLASVASVEARPEMPSEQPSDALPWRARGRRRSSVGSYASGIVSGIWR